MKKLDMIVMALLILGGLNWGLWGVFDFNLVDYVFGRAWIDRLLYFFIGLSGLYAACYWKSIKFRWTSRK